MTRTVLVRRALQVALLAFVAWYVARHWGEYEHVLSAARLDWGAITGSCALVFISYLVLIQTWRQTVQAWGEQLTFADGARIWFISNLGKYVPGKVWAIAAMGTLAREAGISPVAAVGSSLVVQLVNIVTGFGVFVVAGAHVLRLPGGSTAAFVALALALVCTPWLVPFAVRTLNRVSTRQFAVPHLPARAIWWAGTGTTLAWVLYGVAFQWFVAGISGGATAGTTGDWIAIFVGPYLLGFVALFSPGGLGVREGAMLVALEQAGLATGALAALLVTASRLWLTVLEIIPGVLFLMIHPANRRISSNDT
ncbi:MAG: lysylphosphatidylglycerol synthase domain-containing protein [Gemmatimonadetes bacterium]|nr:lysylphosphatidylglycerol synthase domain-containing protein [Gemmatimonadota bacterium]